MKKLVTGLVCSLLLSGCTKTSTPIKRTEVALHTVISFTVYDSKDESIIDDCIDMCKAYDLVFSPSNKDSELYKLNHNKNKLNKQKVSKELYEVLEKGYYYSELTNGKFDITIGSVSSLWDFECENPKVPSDASIKDALKHVGYKNIVLENQTITYKDKKTMIDLGAISKGYIASCAKAYLIDKGVNQAIIDLGGNIVCIGDKNQEHFRIGVKDPKNNNNYIMKLIADNNSIVTSGNYERYITKDNINYHHILDPKTGYSCFNDVASVSIITPSSFDADCLSTVCFLLGKEEAIKLLNSIEETYGCVIDSNNQIAYSKGFKNYIEK